MVNEEEFEFDEVFTLFSKILIHEGYLLVTGPNKMKLTTKGQIVVREVESV